jgi:hypothetical protein
MQVFVEVKEENEKLYLYKDGELLSEVTEPTIMWDTKTRRILQIGDKDNVLNYYHIARDICKRKNENLHEHWLVRELPKKAEVINHLLANPEDVVLFEHDKALEEEIA